MNNKVKQIIDILKLTPHPEGGFFNEIYRAKEVFPINEYYDKYNSERNISTSIYYLLNEDDISKFHRIKSDEIWHFYEGSSIQLYLLNPDGSFEVKILGNKILEGQNYQIIIPAGVWFAAELIDKTSYALLACTVAPGFCFDDFEFANQAELMNNYPDCKLIIQKMT